MSAGSDLFAPLHSGRRLGRPSPSYGMLSIARDPGLADALARAMRRLFPDVPSGHPAEGAVLMNVSANILRLGEAATPFGLKAMRELQNLNPIKDTNVNAMATFRRSTPAASP